MTALRWLVALAAALCLAACTVGPQPRPVAIDVTLSPPTEPDDPGSGTRSLVVYFVRDARLEPVARLAPSRSAASALELLQAGPTPVEAAADLHTVIPPQSLLSASPGGEPNTVVVGVSREFASVSGDTQLLAVAQVVWTVTEPEDVYRVRITVDGAAVEVPTDQGLVRRPVTRRDFMSLGPARSATQSPSEP